MTCLLVFTSSGCVCIHKFRMISLIYNVFFLCCIDEDQHFSSVRACQEIDYKPSAPARSPPQIQVLLNLWTVPSCESRLYSKHITFHSAGSYYFVNIFMYTF